MIRRLLGEWIIRWAYRGWFTGRVVWMPRGNGTRPCDVYRAGDGHWFGGPAADLLAKTGLSVRQEVKHPSCRSGPVRPALTDLGFKCLFQALRSFRAPLFCRAPISTVRPRFGDRAHSPTAGTRGQTSAAALAGAGALTSAAIKLKDSAAALSGAGTLTAAPRRWEAGGATSLSGTGSLSAAPNRFASLPQLRSQGSGRSQRTRRKTC